MEIGAILFSLAMILVVASYILQPLFTPERSGTLDTRRELSALQAERDRVLDSIQEIEVDHTMGKVSELDYEHQRGSLVLEGAGILRSIDELLSDGAPDESEMELEAAVAELRGKSSVSGSQQNGDETNPACPTCGQSIYHGDRFCSNCGATLKEQVA